MDVTKQWASDQADTTILPSRQRPSDLMSKETYEIINDVISGYLALVISVVGIPANLVTCSVFWRQGLRDRMNLCLFCLAAVDLLYLLPVLSVGPFLRLARNARAQEYTLRILNVGVSVIYSLRATSGCYNMIIAVERCVCVVFPLKAASLLQTRTMGVLLAVCFILVQLGYLVVPLEYNVVNIEVGGMVEWRLVPTQLFLDKQELFRAVEMSVLTVSLPIITFLVVFITAVITVIKLTAALKWREKTSSTCREKVGHQTALTKMILVVSFIYICTMIPTVSVMFTRLLVDEFSPNGRYHYLFMGSTVIAYVCPRFHSASNFFVFYSRSSRFRSVLVSKMCCKENKRVF